MYSAIGGLDADLFDSRAPGPFGGFRYVGPPLERPLRDDEILLNEWMAQDLRAEVGDTVKLTYHVSGSRGELPEASTSFRLAGIVSLKEGSGNDRGLVPEVPGITDADSLADWNQPFPMKLDRITSRDDEYWDEYRATPKMFITLATARELFRNRYGALTSVRVAIPEGVAATDARDRLARGILDFVQPEQLGLTFRDIRAEGLKAAGGSNDFGGLFIGFSFFLIVAAAILVALLFRLAIEQRPQQVGLLVAVGFRPESVRRLLLAEAFVISVAGVACGLLLAAAYSRLVIHGLTTWWVGAVGTNQLRLHLNPATLATGGAISLPLGMLATWWGLRGLTKVSPRGLLSGSTELPETEELREGRRRRGVRNGVLAGVPAVCCVLAGVVGALPEREAFGGLSIRVVGFFLSGLLGLSALLWLFGAWLAGNESLSVRGAGTVAALRMGWRNAGRQRLRSTMSAGMIAVATFLIVAIAAGKKNPAVEAPALASGNGGFTLVAETEIPVLYDITTPEGREKLNLTGDDAAKPGEAVRQIVPFRVQPGENASCTNIFQTSQPTILGVPDDMERRGGFKFVGAGRGNPWSQLHGVPGSNDGVVPVFGDMNTLQYSLHVGPGSILELRDGNNQPFMARVDGMFDGSVFQGVLLMSEANFQRLFPQRVGFQYFLVDTPLERSTEVGRWLESRVPGLDVDLVGDRLTDFLAVQNTYLSTFQALGGLGLLLGTLGLGTVLLRNVLERRSEIALLRAVGHTPGGLAVMILGENLLVLSAGLGMGTLAALVAMLPQILGVSADVAWGAIAGQLGLVLVAGLLASWWAVRAAASTPIVGSLRGD
jgi:ABC-type lipoprotein release transport system permease subunit